MLRYLARYTHRIAISNSRITACKDGKISFGYHDRKHGYVKKTMIMDAVLFMQKFLLHVLPSRFVRIRYYGFMGNKVRSKNIALIRELLGEDFAAEPEQIPSGWVDMMIFLTGNDPLVCSQCGKGRLQDVTAGITLEQAGCG